MQNQSKPSIRHILAGLVAASLLACAAPPGEQGHARHHPGQVEDARPSETSSIAPAQGGSMMGGSTSGSGGGCAMMGGAKTDGACNMQNMNQDEMCAMYRSMRDAPDEQARQAMMERHMQGMSPQMRQQHLDMMRQQCQ